MRTTLRTAPTLAGAVALWLLAVAVRAGLAAVVGVGL